MRTYPFLIAAILLCLAGPALCAPFVCVLPGPDGDPALAEGAVAIVEFALRDLPVAVAASRRQTSWVLSDMSVAGGAAPSRDAAIEVARRIGAESIIQPSLRDEDGAWIATCHIVTLRAPEEAVFSEGKGPDALGALFDTVTFAAGRLAAEDKGIDAGVVAWPPTTNHQAFIAFCEGCTLDGDPQTYEGAVAALKRAVDLDPHFIAARMVLANVLREQGKLDAAVEHLKAALLDRPQMAVLHANLGGLLADLGRYDEAEIALTEAINIGTDALAAAYAHNNLGLVYRRMDLLDKALTEFERARRMLPKYSMAHANIGWIYMSTEQYERATLALQRVIEFRNDRWALGFAYRLLGDIAVKHERFPDAIAAYEQALGVRPDYAMVYNQLGYTYKKQGDLQAAKQAYTRAIELGTDTTAAAYAHNNLGNIYRDEGDLQRAAEEYEKALALKPDYEKAKENLKKLREGAQ